MFLDSKEREILIFKLHKNLVYSQHSCCYKIQADDTIISFLETSNVYSFVDTFDIF